MSTLEKILDLPASPVISPVSPTLWCAKGQDAMQAGRGAMGGFIPMECTGGQARPKFCIPL